MRKGFTLIETIVALGVLLVGLVGVIKMQLVGSMATTHSADIITARNLAQNYLDQFVSQGPDFIIGPASDANSNCKYTEGIVVPDAPNNLTSAVFSTATVPTTIPASGKVTERNIDFNLSYQVDINYINNDPTRIIGINTTCGGFDKLTRAAMLTVFVRWTDRLSGSTQSAQANTLITYQ